MESIAELQASVSEHERYIETLRAQYECSQREAETLANQISELATEMQSKDRQLEELQGQESNENVDGGGNTTPPSQADPPESVGTELKAVLLSEHHIEPSSSTGDMESTQVSDLREKLEVESNRNERLQTQLAQLVTEKEGLEQEIGRLENELEESRSVSVTASSAIGETLKTEEGMDSGLTSMAVTGVGVDKKSQEMHMLEKVQLEAESVREKLQASEEQKSKLQSLVQERESRIAELETESEEARAQLSQVAAELNTALREKELKIEHCERNLQEVSKLLNAREEEVAALRRECEERNDSQSRARGNEIHENLRQSTAALELVTRERDELLGSMRAKQREVEDVGMQLAEAHASLNTMNHEVQQIKSENAELAQTVERSKTEMQSIISERDGLMKRVSTLEDTAQTSREELTIKETECSKLTKQLEHLKAHLVQVQSPLFLCVTEITSSYFTHTHTSQFLSFPS